MKESFLHYIWQQGTFNKQNLGADTGETVTIIDTGRWNHNAGPDFINAKIEIDGTLWVGNVEIHTDAALWEQHGHHTNPAYDNVVLHVALNNTAPIINSDGRRIPAIILDYPNELADNYQNLVTMVHPIACHQQFRNIDSLYASFWLNHLAIERIEEKTEFIEELLKSTTQNWSEAFYIALVRNFWAPVNSEPFERLARSTPLKVIAHHQHNQFQLEALLFGQAGLLPKSPDTDYTEQLCQEYNYYRKKYQLTPIEASAWKFHKLRPLNFPTVRIAQLASLIANSTHLFSKILEATSVTEYEKLLLAEVGPYWLNHYQMDKPSSYKPKAIGQLLKRSLIINTFIPFVFYYHKYQKDPYGSEFAIKLLEEMKPEENNITKLWSEIGIKAKNALESQALIHLKKSYCDTKQCIKCQVGHKVISGSI